MGGIPVLPRSWLGLPSLRFAPAPGLKRNAPGVLPEPNPIPTAATNSFVRVSTRGMSLPYLHFKTVLSQYRSVRVLLGQAPRRGVAHTETTFVFERFCYLGQLCV